MGAAQAEIINMNKTFTVGVNGSFPNPLRSNKSREEKIRDLAYWIWEMKGNRNAEQNWYDAERTIEIFEQYKKDHDSTI